MKNMSYFPRIFRKLKYQHVQVDYVSVQGNSVSKRAQARVIAYDL